MRRPVWIVTRDPDCNWIPSIRNDRRKSVLSDVSLCITREYQFSNFARGIREYEGGARRWFFKLHRIVCSSHGGYRRSVRLVNVSVGFTAGGFPGFQAWIPRFALCTRLVDTMTVSFGL